MPLFNVYMATDYIIYIYKCSTASITWPPYSSDYQSRILSPLEPHPLIADAQPPITSWGVPYGDITRISPSQGPYSTYILGLDITPITPITRPERAGPSRAKPIKQSSHPSVNRTAAVLYVVPGREPAEPYHVIAFLRVLNITAIRPKRFAAMLVVRCHSSPGVPNISRLNPLQLPPTRLSKKMKKALPSGTSTSTGI